MLPKVETVRTNLEQTRLSIQELLLDRSLTKEQRLVLYKVLGDISTLDSDMLRLPFITHIPNKPPVQTRSNYVI